MGIPSPDDDAATALHLALSSTRTPAAEVLADVATGLDTVFTPTAAPRPAVDPAPALRARRIP